MDAVVDVKGTIPDFSEEIPATALSGSCFCPASVAMATALADAAPVSAVITAV